MPNQDQRTVLYNSTQRNHCLPCEVAWTSNVDGPACWVCGRNGAAGNLPLKHLLYGMPLSKALRIQYIQDQSQARQVAA